MPRSVLVRRGLPLLGAFGALLGGGVALGAWVQDHRLVELALWLGPVGSALIAASFGYSLRKRGVLRLGSPRVWLRVHEALAWSGAFAVLVHAGCRVHAWLPWAGVGAMLAAATSGMLGELLLGRARAQLSERERVLRKAGLAQAEVDRRLMVDALALRALELWRVVHLPVAITFAVLAAVHAVTAVALR